MDITLAPRFFYRIQSGDDINSLIMKFNTSKTNIIRNNAALDLYPGEMVEIVVNDYHTHIVKPVESLTDIARIYNINEEKIIEDNALKTRKLYIGQPIKIYKK